MSTILDALKKSERERKLDKIPTLGTMRPPEEGRSTGTWMVLLSVLICVTAGFVAWIYFSRPAQEPPPAAVAAPNPSPPVENQGAAVPVDTAIPAAESSAAPVAPDVVEFRSLPSSTAAQLPKLTVSVISWSDESDRNFVMMDSGIYRVGDVIADGLVLEEIEPDAAVLNYLGQRIRVRP